MFVRPGKRALCQTVADLGHKINVPVCAEGVENAEDVRCLIELGFDTAQGFFFAKPMSAGSLVEFLIELKNGRGPKWIVEPPAIPHMHSA
ncbi:MAG: EAL domain-containing protein [Xanthobacteraceae bacterium]|nr:EAL domain-containing protein [Xanthobacteraceae bacterium]